VILYPAPRRPPSPKWAAPAAHKQPGGPESFSGKETAHPGSSQNLLYSGASRAGMASARRPPLLPHLPPNLPAPTREQFLREIWAGRTLPGRASRRRKHPCSLRGPKCLCNVSSVVLYSGWVRAGRHARAQGAVSGCVSRPMRVDTKPKITAHHSRTYKARNIEFVFTLNPLFVGGFRVYFTAFPTVEACCLTSEPSL